VLHQEVEGVFLGVGLLGRGLLDLADGVLLELDLLHREERLLGLVAVQLQNLRELVQVLERVLGEPRDLQLSEDAPDEHGLVVAQEAALLDRVSAEDREERRGQGRERPLQSVLDHHRS